MQPTKSAVSGALAVSADKGELYELLDEFSSRLQQGEDVDEDSFIARHSEYADDLRRLLPAARALANLGGSVPSRDGTAPHRTGELPIEELGDFRLIREIGRGGMGVVYEAHQVSLGRRVALKVLPFAGVLDARQLQRFKNEARAAATLDHPHIVAVYSVGEERGVHYYAMQLIAGPSLAELIAEWREPGKRGRSPGAPAVARADRPSCLESTEQNAKPATAVLSSIREHFRRAAEWGIQAARALEFAHRRGIVHRDVKPSNLLIDAAGQLWIADFGLAVILGDSDLTVTGDLLGTLRYMSPEQARGDRQALDHRTDVYSLGATLYELLTLQPAFPSTDRQQLLQQIAGDEPAAMREIRRDVPIDLETIVGKALAKEPARRYATAAALAADLERFLDGRPILARPSTVTERTAKWVRRHPALALLMAVVALAAVAIPAALAAHIQQLREVNEALRKKTEDALTNAREANESKARALANEHQSRLHEYSAALQLAAQHANEGNPTPVRGLLARWLPENDSGPDIRGPEWALLWDDLPQSVAAATHSLPTSVTHATLGRISPNSKYRGLVATSSYGKICAASLSADGSAINRLLQTAGPISSAPVWIQTDAGNQVAAASEKGLAIWDFETGTLVREFPTHEAIRAQAVSPSGTRLIWYSAKSQQIHVCDWPSGTELFKVDAAGSDSLFAFSTDGDSEFLYYIRRPGFWRLNLTTGVQQQLLTFGGFIHSFAVSPRGETLAICGHGIDLYGLPSGRHRAHLAGSDFITDVALNSKNQLVSGTGNGAVQWWDTSTGRELERLQWQKRAIGRVAWTDDGESVVAATDDSQLHHWQLKRNDQEIRESGYALGPVAVAGDATTIAFADDCHQIWVADGELTSPPRLLEREPWPVAELQLSPDGKSLAVLDDRSTSLWECDSATQLWSGDVYAATCLRFSPDGESLAVGRQDGDVLVISFADGQPAAHLLGRQGPPVSDIVLLPNQDRIVVAGGLPEVTVHSIDNSNRNAPIRIASPRTEPIHQLSTIPGGSRILAQDSGRMGLEFDVATLQDGQLMRLRDIYSSSAGFQVLTNGRELAVDGGTTIVDFTNRTESWRIDSDAAIKTAACSADGRFVAAITSHGDLLRWDRSTFTTRRLPHWGLRPVHDLAFSNGGSRLLAGTYSMPQAWVRENNSHPLLQAVKTTIRSQTQPWDRTIDSLRAWNLDDSTEFSAFENLETRVPQQFVEAADQSDRLVTGGHDGSVLIWDQITGRALPRKFVSSKSESYCQLCEGISRVVNVVPNYPASGEVLAALAVSRDGQRVAAVGHRGGTRVWQLSDGRELCSKVLDPGSAFLGWTADDRWLVTSAIERVRLIDPNTGEVGPVGGKMGISRISTGVVSPDGRLLATGHDDRSIRVWSFDANTDEPQEIETLAGHVGSVLSLAISNDGRRLVSGGSDGGIKFWSLETYEEVAHIAKFRGPVHVLRFSPDGRYLAAGGEDESGHGEIRLWDVELRLRESEAAQ